MLRLQVFKIFVNNICLLSSSSFSSTLISSLHHYLMALGFELLKRQARAILRRKTFSGVSFLAGECAETLSDLKSDYARLLMHHEF